MKSYRSNIRYIVTVLLLAISSVAVAQNAKLERVHAMKVAFLTDKIHLNSSQAEKFWPVYNRFEMDSRAVRQKYRRGGGNTKDRSEDETRRQIENNLDLQEEMISLKRRYKDEFLKIISPTQLADLYNSEKEFRQLLVRELRDRRARKGTAQGLRKR